jgi:hypothetical protein
MRSALAKSSPSPPVAQARTASVGSASRIKATSSRAPLASWQIRMADMVGDASPASGADRSIMDKAELGMGKAFLDKEPSL